MGETGGTDNMLNLGLEIDSVVLELRLLQENCWSYSKQLSVGWTRWTAERRSWKVYMVSLPTQAR